MGEPKISWPLRRQELAENFPPEDVEALMDWETTNERRSKLIDKKIAGTIRADEAKELQRLQRLAGFIRTAVMPLPKLPPLSLR